MVPHQVHVAVVAVVAVGAIVVVVVVAAAAATNNNNIALKLFSEIMCYYCFF